MNTDIQLLKQCAVKGAEAAVSSLDAEEPARIAFAQAAIQHYLKLNPVWVSTRDRMPTKEDEDKEEVVAVFSEEYGFSYMSAERIKEASIHYFWCSVKSIPSRPDAEREKFEQWYEKQQFSMPGTKEQLFQVWKAAKES